MTARLRLDTAPEYVAGAAPGLYYRTPAGLLVPVGGSPDPGNVPIAAADGSLVWGAPGTVPGGGPGVGTYSYYDPLKPPAAPSALDFEGGTPGGADATAAFNAHFPSRVNWPAVYNVNVTLPGGLFASLPLGGGTLRAALLALPAGDFQVAFEPIVPQRVAATTYVGLVFTNGTTAGAGSQHLFAFANNNNALQYLELPYTNFTTNGGVTGRNVISGARFLRVRRIGAAWEAASSANLRHWGVQGTTAPGFTPTHVGIGLLSFDAAGMEVGGRAFRYSTDTAALFGGVRTVFGS